MERDSERYQQWKAMHDRMGWTWLPATAHEHFYFPDGEPEQAIAEFHRRLNEGRGNDDAA
jgi:hypothetical protein